MGSFGDNELCPEILAQFDKPRPDLIMIPSSYTSYIQPVYTPFKIKTISLIKLSNYYALGEEQQLWEWEHPGDFQPNRIAKLSFPNKKGYKVSGFLGWFTCTLYGHINIQIHSPSLSTYCKSWYPIYFPVHRTKVKPDHNIHLEFKRINNGENVWYEYTFHGKVYNENGVDYCMKLLDNQ
ncbi:uncharacterized protein SPAPADRAFT_61265 [Spathaspora passalidarum NRRL Y-27907]|uniref:PRMT5 oligomerisation domain-containing protein n=1 Tax=Spathaspora passalidarum (strain NRRL Y-27907 / 11-Y1) TaxID=619300 RepID=G3APK8_SPAPN|nr:uncharacterized protein SPAPADRAFT_61265 [Spathaspora passalidarum NRRL Y-27907]EGW32179.1 hypothetical protein SPAPADRAFT_61265 [Spathaspora passalidarum NRRL Y-27907]